MAYLKQIHFMKMMILELFLMPVLQQRDTFLFCQKEHAAKQYLNFHEETASKVFVLAKKIATVLKEVTGCEGVNILQNNGEIAGQTVFHFHMHIIPRYKGDTANIKWVQNEVDQAVVDEIISKAKDLL